MDVVKTLSIYTLFPVGEGGLEPQGLTQTKG